MLRNIFWMGLSGATRLGTGFVLFILIARHLGPEEFGHYMFWYGTTVLCALLANYGLSNMLLKEVAQQPENVTKALSEALSLRLTLSAGIFLCAMLSSMVVERPKLFLALLLAHLIEAISETLYVAYRALGHYARESQLAACVSIVQLIFVIGAVMTGQNTETIAIAYLAGKFAQLTLILPVSKRTFGAFSVQTFYMTRKLAVRAKAYAIDHLLVSTFGNIDSIVLRICAGVDTVGIYQSGMRIFQGGTLVAPILANVFLPEIAKQAMSQEKKPRTIIALQIVFLTYGAIFGMVLAYFPELIVNLAFGESYSQLIALLPLFGLLFFVRFFAAAWGVILTAAGYQAYRAKATAIYLIFALALGSGLTYSMHVQGWLIALILAHLLLGILLMVHAIRSGQGGSATLSACAVLAGGLLFVPQLSFGA